MVNPALPRQYCPLGFLPTLAQAAFHQRDVHTFHPGSVLGRNRQREKPKAPGCWLLVVGCWLLVAYGAARADRGYVEALRLAQGRPSGSVHKGCGYLGYPSAQMNTDACRGPKMNTDKRRLEVGRVAQEDYPCVCSEPGLRNQEPATKNQQPTTNNQQPATNSQFLRDASLHFAVGMQEKVVVGDSLLDELNEQEHL